MTNERIIQTKFLTKTYKDICAVADNNICVKKGEIYGFLGLNGAGKTTTIRMLLGFIRPTAGDAFLAGQLVKPNSTSIWAKTGYMVEIPHAYPMLTVWENLDLIRRMRKISDKKAVDRIIDLLGLTSYAKRKSMHLSLGNKQRLGLAKAMIHNPDILILDEPANGLDPTGIHDIRIMLSDLAKKNGTTILISSHILSEISLFATRIGIIHKGRMIREIDANSLDSLCNKQLVIKTSDNQNASILMTNMGITEISHINGEITTTDKNAISSPAEIANMMISNNFDLNKLVVEEENLESFFLHTIKESETNHE